MAKKPDLVSLVQRLTPAEINRLVGMARSAPRLARLEKRRDKLAGQLAAVEKELDLLTGGKPAKPARKPARAATKRARRNARAVAVEAEVEAAPKRKPGRKPGRQPKAEKTAKAVKARPAKKAAGKRGGRRGVRGAPGDLLNSVVKVMVAEGRPMNRKEVVDALPAAGYKVTDANSTLKAVSQLFLTRKKSFDRMDRGTYRLVESES